MAKTLPKTKAQIIAALAEEAKITKAQSKIVMEKLVALACEGSKREGGFTIPGLGKLVLEQRKARMGRNPATGESIKIPAKKVLKFRISKAAKDAVVPPKK